MPSSTYTRKVLVVLYNCNKGHKMGTLLNPMHWTLHVHALGSRVFNYWRFVIDLKASSPTPPIWASSVFTKSLVSPNYSLFLTHGHEKVDDTHWETASANQKGSFFLPTLLEITFYCAYLQVQTQFHKFHTTTVQWQLQHMFLEWKYHVWRFHVLNETLQ